MTKRPEAAIRHLPRTFLPMGVVHKYPSIQPAVWHTKPRYETAVRASNSHISNGQLYWSSSQVSDSIELGAGEYQTVWFPKSAESVPSVSVPANDDEYRQPRRIIALAPFGYSNESPDDTGEQLIV